MKAVVGNERGSFEVRDVPIPIPKDGEVLIRVARDLGQRFRFLRDESFQPAARAAQIRPSCCVSLED
jgi:tryptophanyl-tRNA synthetase